MTVPANEAAEAIAHVEAIAHEPLAADAPEVVVRIENLSKSFDGASSWTTSTSTSTRATSWPSSARAAAARRR